MNGTKSVIIPSLFNMQILVPNSVLLFPHLCANVSIIVTLSSSTDLTISAFSRNEMHWIEQIHEVTAYTDRFESVHVVNIRRVLIPEKSDRMIGYRL